MGFADVEFNAFRAGPRKRGRDRPGGPILATDAAIGLAAWNSDGGNNTAAFRRPYC